MKITELGEYLYLFGNDIRVLHLLAKGDEFLAIHTELNELYDEVFEFYDFATESGIAHDEEITNPSVLADKYSDWIPLDAKDFSLNEIKNYVMENGNYILQCCDEVKDYEDL
jgi:DNA-binding ferritin-like protein